MTCSVTQEFLGNVPTVHCKLLRLTLLGCLVSSTHWNVFDINPSTIALYNGQVYMYCQILEKGKTFC